MSQVFNFSAGPAMIFPEVLHKAQSELTNWLDQGVSVMEVSHRGKYFMELITQAEKDLRTRWCAWSICCNPNEFNREKRESTLFK